jgi:hypothetical protein
LIFLRSAQEFHSQFEEWTNHREFSISIAIPVKNARYSQQLLDIIGVENSSDSHFGPCRKTACDGEDVFLLSKSTSFGSYKIRQQQRLLCLCSLFTKYKKLTMRFVPPVIYRHQSPFEHHAREAPASLAARLSEESTAAKSHPDVMHLDPTNTTTAHAEEHLPPLEGWSFSESKPIVPEHQEQKEDTHGAGGINNPGMESIRAATAGIQKQHQHQQQQQQQQRGQNWDAVLEQIRQHQYHQQHHVTREPPISKEMADRYHIYDHVTLPPHPASDGYEYRL